MCRPLRIEYDGALYHITSRGNARKPIFKDDKDRQTFLDTLQKVNARFHWFCHAYCLMSNHYHLIIETPEGNLSRGMRQLNGVYTQRYNKRHDRVGHLLQGRYKAILIQKERYLLELCRYVVLNPVRAKAVKKAEDEKWSSYRGTAGLETPHPCLSADWILEQFGRNRSQAERTYSAFVKEGIGEASVWEHLKGGSLLGEGIFISKLAPQLKKHEKKKEITKSQRHIGRPRLDQLFKGGADEKRTRDLKIKEAVEKYGYSQREIADYLEMHYSTISRLVNEVE